MSSIQDKVNEKQNNDTKKGESNNWYNFFLYCVLFFAVSLFIMVIGSNFIFINNSEASVLNKFLPTDINYYFKPEQQDGGGGYSCGMKGKFKMPNLESWPYSMRKSASNTKGLLQSFKNWIANTTAETFIMNRELIKKWVELFSSINNVFLLFLIAVITIAMAPLVYIGSLGTALYNAFKTNWKWGLVSFFLVFLWPFIIGISLVQVLQYIFLFLIIPAITDLEGLKEILKCNINTFFIFFGGLVSIASLLTLNNTITIVYTCIYLLMNIISLL
jgi:hypothetical protein